MCYLISDDSAQDPAKCGADKLRNLAVRLIVYCDARRLNRDNVNGLNLLGLVDLIAAVHVGAIYVSARLAAGEDKGGCREGGQQDSDFFHDPSFIKILFTTREHDK